MSKTVPVTVSSDTHYTSTQVNTTDSVSAWRWLIIFVFGLLSTINYLDRQLLAALAPTLKTEFSLSNTNYGAIVSAFSITYMIVAPFAGLLIDRIGLRLGAAASVAVWSLVSAFTGFVTGFNGLFAVRMALGAAEASGIPSSSKASATYLKSREFGLGNALQSIDITLGIILAPIVASLLMPLYGWRGVFAACGILGLLWIPLWLFSSRKAAANVSTSSTPVPPAKILFDKRLWGIVVASSLVMTTYSLWMNWTTIYLVQQHGLAQLEANRYFAWIPPVFASLGGMSGGALAFFLIRRGGVPFRRRMQACYLVAPLLLVTAMVPLLTNTALAVGAISISFFGCMMVVINMHVIPIDLFGVDRAAFASSIVVSGYALMQAILSPVIGQLVDRSSFGSACVLISGLSLVGVLVLRFSVPGEEKFQKE